MKLRIYLIFFFLMCFTSGFAQYVNYEVKVVLDSFKNVRGTLQKVSPEGIAIKDFRDNYYIFKSKNIIKVKVRKKGLTFIEALGGGAGLGLGAGLLAFKDVHSGAEAIVGTAVFTGAGLAGGTVTGLVAEAINSKLTLRINSDPQRFKRDYLKLEKYSKSYYLDKPSITK